MKARCPDCGRLIGLTSRDRFTTHSTGARPKPRTKGAAKPLTREGSRQRLGNGDTFLGRDEPCDRSGKRVPAGAKRVATGARERSKFSQEREAAALKGLLDKIQRAERHALAGRTGPTKIALIDALKHLGTVNRARAFGRVNRNETKETKHDGQS